MKKKSSPARRRKKPAKVASPVTPVSRASVLFPIVGIGASAGGLEALEHFLPGSARHSDENKKLQRKSLAEERLLRAHF